MNWITIIGKAYKKGCLAEGKNGVQYQRLNILDRMKSKEESFYFNCVAFGKQAEYLDKYVENGDEIIVLGECSEDKKDKKINVKINQAIKTSYHSLNKEQKPEPEEDIF